MTSASNSGLPMSLTPLPSSSSASSSPSSTSSSSSSTRLPWPFPGPRGVGKAADLAYYLWRFGSHAVMSSVTLLGGFWLRRLNDVRIHNEEPWQQLVIGRGPRPLISISNHASLIDDPLLHGLLPKKVRLRPDRMRWTLAAEEICFRRRHHALFFALGQTVPVIRGAGIHQRGVDFVLDKLNRDKDAVQRERSPPPVVREKSLSIVNNATANNALVVRLEDLPDESIVDEPMNFTRLKLPDSNGNDIVIEKNERSSMFWSAENLESAYVHVYPEGKVNVSSETWLRLKWGVAELIIRSREPPIVCPVWHVGFDDILPNRRPYFPRIGKRVTIIFGRPIDTGPLLKELRWNYGLDAAAAAVEAEAATDEEREKFRKPFTPEEEKKILEKYGLKRLTRVEWTRKMICDHLENEMKVLKTTARIVHGWKY